jgi:adenylate cyclase
MNILFVCTGNIFRSMSAEYLAKKYIKDQNLKNIYISSAWTVAHPENPFSYTLKRLQKYWCDANNHVQTKLDENVLKDKDFVIVMAKHHLEMVRSLGYEWVLFNLVAYGKNKDLMDDTEYTCKYGPMWDLEKYVEQIVDYIYEAIPKIFSWLKSFEIERKFLVKKLPQHIERYPCKKIIQWYFEDDKNKLIRLRKSITWDCIEYFLGSKKGKWLIRKEYEKQINKKTFDQLWKNVGDRFLEKIRYIIPYKKNIIELDIYIWKLDWLVCVEVEFVSPLKSKKFIIPHWFDKELTWNRLFWNKHLSTLKKIWPL